MKLGKQKIKIIRHLNIKDKQGAWVQIEILDGKDKGMRKPITKEELSK